MKRILLLLTIVLLSSCCGRNFYIKTVSLDYSKYLKKGFFMTESPSVSFEYEPIASLQSIVYSGRDKGRSKKKGNDFYSLENEIRWATHDDGLEAIYQEARQKGANGIINITYTSIYDKEGGIDYIIVRGMAIQTYTLR